MSIYKDNEMGIYELMDRTSCIQNMLAVSIEEHFLLCTGCSEHHEEILPEEDVVQIESMVEAAQTALYKLYQYFGQMYEKAQEEGETEQQCSATVGETIEIEGLPLIPENVEEITQTEQVGDISVTTTTWKFRKPVEHCSKISLADFRAQPNSRSNQF